MSLDTTMSATTLRALSAHPAAEPSAKNAAVITAMQGHHARLAAQLDTLTQAVLAAVPDGQYVAARDELLVWYRAELLPHALAEEQVLYQAASEMEPTRLLIRGMLVEHQALVGLIAELAEASEAVAIAGTAAAAHGIFAVHVVKENDLVLPALDQAGHDLTTVLTGMHELLGQDSETKPDAGAGSIELDVRTLPHGARHEIIFAKLDGLNPGESLVIVNDHDPKPLRYQTSAMWPDRFEWKYLESGPAIWRVAIIRAG